jgi:hypothetical protein
MFPSKTTEVYKINKNPFISFIERIFKEKYNHNDSLSELHRLVENVPKENKESYTHIGILGKDDRVCPFIKDFHEYVDKSDEFVNIYHSFMNENIVPLFNNKKIVIQKTPNIRISFPQYAAIGRNPKEDQEEMIGYHKDANFGHHFTETNFIIPITQMYDSNSLYYENEINSNQYNNLKLETNEFFRGYLNHLHHYNMKNQTEYTRISFDLRVIPYDKYMENLEYFKGTKFELGKYYTIL